MARRRRVTTGDVEAIAILVFILLTILVFLPWQLVIPGAVFIVSVAIYLLKKAQQRKKRRLRERLLLADSLELSPTEFEQRVAILLADLGWQKVEVVGGSGDGGVDIRAESDGFRYIVQCKRYRGLVTPTHVRDLAGALSHEPADRALLITTGHVTDQTRDWIRGKPVYIWDGSLLAKQILKTINSNQHSQIIAQQKQANQRLFKILAGINLVTVMLVACCSIATVIPRISRPQANLQPAIRPSTQPTTPPTEQPTTEPTPPTAQPTALVYTGIVANGGNVRESASLQAKVLDQVHANELVLLLGQTSDGWVNIINLRDVNGWVHISLLNIESPILEQIPTVEP